MSTLFKKNLCLLAAIASCSSISNAEQVSSSLVPTSGGQDFAIAAHGSAGFIAGSFEGQ